MFRSTWDYPQGVRVIQHKNKLVTFKDSRRGVKVYIHITVHCNRFLFK